MSPVTIKIVQDPEDTRATWEALTAEFWHEHQIGDGPSLALDLPKVGAKIVHCVRRGRLVEAYIGFELAGTLGLHPDSPWWSSESMLYDAWFYVRRKYRNSGAAQALMRYAVEYSIESGLPLAMAIWNCTDFDRLEPLYLRHGFVKQGTFFVRRV